MQFLWIAYMQGKSLLAGPFREGRNMPTRIAAVVILICVSLLLAGTALGGAGVAVKITNDSTEDVSSPFTTGVSTRHAWFSQMSASMASRRYRSTWWATAPEGQRCRGLPPALIP
jgi:hypothetical protein